MVQKVSKLNIRGKNLKSLSELTPMVFKTGLTQLGSDASKSLRSMKNEHVLYKFLFRIFEECEVV